MQEQDWQSFQNDIGRLKAGAVRKLQSRSGSIMFLYRYFQLSGKIIEKVTQYCVLQSRT